jgi:hypothetical protein
MAFGVIDLLSLSQGGVSGIADTPYEEITFPLSLPVNVSPRRISFRGMNSVAMTSSAYTYAQQIQSNNADLWLADVALPPMIRSTAEEWIAFLLTLQGQLGTFLIGDPLGATPRGVATGTPLVKDGMQTGRKLTTKGWTPLVNGILKAGDWIQLGQRGHKVLRDANSDSAGDATLDIWPRLREVPAEDDPIVTSNVKILMRLASSNFEIWNADETLAYGLTFSAIEAI